LVRAGYDVSVYDLDSSKAEAVIELGATWGDSPAKIGKTADVFLTCLPSAKAVNEVLTGENGAFSTLSKDSVWVEMTTNSKAEILRLAELAEEKGIGALDAPLTGGAHKVPTANMRIFVSGEEKLFQRLKALFEVMGGKVLYTGALGDATKMKLISNMLCFINLISMGEALMLAKKSGIDLKIAYDAIKMSSGHSYVHDVESQVILSGSYDAQYNLNLAVKDSEFLLELAEEVGVPAHISEFVDKTFREARDNYGGEAQYAKVVKLLEDELGEDLRAEGFPKRLVDKEVKASV
jgi:3-hydroxyisobutyrate dehydrogenase